MSVIVALGDEWFARLSDITSAGNVPGSPDCVKIFLRGSETPQVLNFDSAELAGNFRRKLREALEQEAP